MSNIIHIASEDILQQIRLSCKIPELVEAIVTRKVLADAAAEAGITIETEDIQKAADTIRLMNKLYSADETRTWLQKYSLSLEDFEQIAHTKIISGKLAKHLFADKVEPWFVEHQLDYAEAMIYEVVLDNEDLAMELSNGLEKGEMSFPEIARQYIQDKELLRTGGYQRMVRWKELMPEISAAVFAAKPPQVLKPIVTSLGVHLILVEELIQPQLDNNLHSKIILDLFSEWKKHQIEQIKVVISLQSSSQAI